MELGVAVSIRIAATLGVLFCRLLRLFYRQFIIRSRYLMAPAIFSLVVAAWQAPLLEIVLPVAGTYLLFYIAYHPRIRFFTFAKKGDFSYGLYLYGWPIQQLAVYFWAEHLSAHGLFFITFPVTLLAAYGSWHLVERPFLKLKGRLKKSVS